MTLNTTGPCVFMLLQKDNIELSLAQALLCYDKRNMSQDERDSVDKSR